MATNAYRQYPESLLESDEVFYHQGAMTSEQLHRKAEIAAELAYRDLIIRGARLEIEDAEHSITRLRGQLQNCVNHLDRASRKGYGGKFDEAIESANRALYETLHK